MRQRAANVRAPRKTAKSRRLRAKAGFAVLTLSGGLSALAGASCNGEIGSSALDPTVLVPAGTPPAVSGSSPRSAPTDPGATSPAASTEQPSTSASCSSAPAGVARVTVRRLNRTEYNNTVRDLLGDKSRPADGFPSDEVADLFDNDGSTLALSPLLFEKLEAAADRLAAQAISGGLVGCDAKTSGAMACARQVLAPFAERAWRRPIAEDELQVLLAFVTAAEREAEPFSSAVQNAVKTVLLSPHFLYRFELIAEAGAAKPQPLGPFEVASRLSYFLWSSMPDPELFEAARSGRLRDPGELDRQIRRMLADSKAEALTDEMTRQWLLGRMTEVARPDPEKYSLDEDLRRALQTETKLFLQAFLSEDLDFRDLLDAEHSFLDERVAKHYGIPGVAGAQFRKVSLAGNRQRGGLLTHGNIHVGTGHPLETSVTVRGEWVLKRLLCSPPPPPPPDAEAKAAQPDPNAPRKIREAQIKSGPDCRACHLMMDGIGFALENYDVVGRWRTKEEGDHDVDATGELPGLGRFDGARELGALIKRDPRYTECVAGTFLTFALGRMLEESDRCAVQDIVTGAAQGRFRLRELLAAVARSTPFLNQPGEPPTP
jgi:hypothetical protein